MGLRFSTTKTRRNRFAKPTRTASLTVFGLIGTRTGRRSTNGTLRTASRTGFRRGGTRTGRRSRKETGRTASGTGFRLGGTRTGRKEVALPSRMAKKSKTKTSRRHRDISQTASCFRDCVDRTWPTPCSMPRSAGQSTKRRDWVSCPLGSWHCMADPNWPIMGWRC